ncbi:MAG: RsmE family RNA methyltransferase [Bdellovibrionota bacterium]
MKRVLCSEMPRKGHPVLLVESEAQHLTRVLRLKDGDAVEAMDGKGHSARVILRTRGGPPRVEFSTQESTEAQLKQEEEASVLPITLEMAMLKGEAMEWVIEKSVELGVDRLVPVLTAHTIIQFKNKGPEAFQERWQKISDQALKQCGRLRSMKVEAPIKLDELIMNSPPGSLRLWCDERSVSEGSHLSKWLRSWKKPGPISLLVGPEGGWSDFEYEMITKSPGQTEKVVLGPLVLRAETAAISGLTLVAGEFWSR